MAPKLTPERLAALPVDPELILWVIEEIAADRRPKHRQAPHGLLLCCARVYALSVGLDAEAGVAAFGDRDLEIVSALALRMAALSDVIASGGLRPGAVAHEHLAAAASAARLTAGPSGLSFQLLDFLAHVERARTG